MAAGDWNAQQASAYTLAQYDAQMAVLEAVKKAATEGSAAAARDLAEALTHLRKG
jgi:ABC-type branched-subunit amino acid transport system substrate-binding protein